MRPISNGKKAIIHVAKSQLGLSDPEYLDILATHGDGAQSSRDLTDRTFAAVMDHFKRLGFVPKRKFRRPASSKQQLTSKISAICNELGLTERYLDGMARKMFGRESYRWLDGQELYKLTQALACHQKRVRARKMAAAGPR
jgi:phage gp16-like protein